VWACLEMCGFHKDYEDIFKEVEAFSMISILFKEIVNGIEAFEKGM
jgi:hypothetical protein